MKLNTPESIHPRILLGEDDGDMRKLLAEALRDWEPDSPTPIVLEIPGSPS